MKNLHVLPTNKKPIKGDLLLRHIWKNDPKLECISWWRYNDTIVIDDVLQYTTLNGSFRDIASSFKAQNIYITSDEKIKEKDWFFRKSYAFGQHNGAEILLSKDDRKIILTTDQDLIDDGVQAIDDEFLEWFCKNPSCESVEVEKGCVLYDFKYKIIIPKEEAERKIDTCYNFDREIGCVQDICRCEQEEPKQEQDKNKYSEEEVKKIALDFFYFWWNAKGNNTEQGFDKWFEHFKKK